tara:strand:+ start:10956 stop:12881 length:1926 start_codon:yes stop_codon:yes gene_type:complete
LNTFRKFFLSLFAISLVLICSAEKVDTQKVKQLAIQALVLENSNPDSSILLAKSILKESLSANYNQGLSYAYHRLGSSFNAIGLNDSALIYINKAIVVRTELKDTAALISSLISRSYLFEEVAKIDSAYADLIQVLHFSEKLGDTISQLKGFIRLSQIELNLNQLDSAKIHLEKAQSLLNDQIEPHYHHAVLNGLGKHAFAINQFQLAKEYFIEQQAYIQENEELLKADNLLNQALCADELQDTILAIELYDKAKLIYLSLAEIPSLALIHYNLGMLYSERSNFSEAISNFKKGLDFARQIDQLDLRAKIHQELADCYEKTEDYSSSLFHLKDYLKLHDSLINISKVESLTEMQTKYETEKKIQQIELLNQKTKAQQAERNFILAVAMVLLLMLISLGIYFIQRNRIAKRNARIAQQELEAVLDEQEIKTYNAMLEGQEEERMRIATDLHDRLGSMLSTIKLMFNSLEEKVDKAQIENQKQYAKANDLLDQACTEVRTISHNLGTGMVANFGLQRAMEELCESIDQTGKVKCQFLNHNLANSYKLDIEINLYRITQEALNNAIKHAKAKLISVQLNDLGNELSLHIEDDGQGFDQQNLDLGMGLKNLEKRAEKIAGHLHIDSSLGRGTSIIVEVPLNKEST